MKEETWKDIPGFEGYYQVSDLGRVRSLDREIICKDGRVIKRKSKIMKTFIDIKGKQCLKLVKDTKRYSKKIHVLVALTFIGPRPEGYDVCHIDGDPNNNKVSNLKYDTSRENKIDFYRYGSKVPNSKLTVKQVVEIRNLYKTGCYTQKEIGLMYNIDYTTVRGIVNRETYTYINDDGTIKESVTEVRYTG